MILENKKLHSLLCQIVVGPQFQNFMSLCCLKAKTEEKPLSKNLFSSLQTKTRFNLFWE